MAATPSISAECLGWAHTADYDLFKDENAGILILSSPAGARYYIRSRSRGRLELSSASAGEDPEILLFTETAHVLECHLYVLLGDEIREDVSLPFLELPYSPTDLAAGYHLGEMQRGYRVLSRVGHGPIAAAPDAQLSLVTLVPLSHLVGLPPASIKRSYLSEDGAPLLSSPGRYARHN